MTRRLMTATAWLTCVAVLPAQAPPAGPPSLGPPTATATPPAVVPPPAAPVSAEVWAHLVNWETVMKAATNLYSKGTKTVEYKAGPRKGTRQYTTDIMCKMPGKARMNVTAVPPPGQKADPNDYEAFIATGSAVLEYSGPDKKLTETALPPGGASGQLLLDFLSGRMTARATVDRFGITLLKEDENYIYLQLTPKLQEDQENFETMIIVLFRNLPDRPGYLPRQAVMRRKNNQEEETWTFSNPAINVQGIQDSYFLPVPVDPKTWNHVKQNIPLRRPAPAVGLPAAIPGTPAVVPTPGTPPK
jgi:TIGR03009 family protein